MYSELELEQELDTDMLIKLVIQKIYQKFGVCALLIVDELHDDVVTEKATLEMAQTMSMPWLSIDILYLREMPLKFVNLLKSQDVVINAIYDLKTFNSNNQVIEPYICLFLSELNISDSEKYANFSFKNTKDRIVYRFLKLGKTVYYQSEDLDIEYLTHSKFIELQSQRIQTLGALGFEMLGQKVQMIEGFCDIKRLKTFEGKTVVLAENVVLSPLAKDYIKSGAITIVRK